LITSRCRNNLLENCDLGYAHKGIDEKNSLRWLKRSRNTIRLLAVSAGFLPVTRRDPAGSSNRGFIDIHSIVITSVVNEFVEIDVELDPDDDYQDIFIRIFPTLTK
jgi:hypothetical protein